MELVIKISEEDYKLIKSYGKDSTNYHISLNLYDAVKNGTPIPENATNGDVIKAMFPSLTIRKINGDVNLFTGEPILKNVLASIDEVLWNSPYKECDKE